MASTTPEKQQVGWLCKFFRKDQKTGDLFVKSVGNMIFSRKLKKVFRHIKG